MGATGPKVVPFMPRSDPPGTAEFVERATVGVREVQAKEDVAAVDAPVDAGLALEAFAADQFVQVRVGAAVGVKAGSKPSSRPCG
ncbi:hypothetical protein ADK90_19355 [Streptomyces sp. XY413]|nr:hypothetical protein ADK90_19355 [Streptomyces sp. XY413]